MTFWGVPPVWIFHACLEPLFGVVFLHQNVATEQRGEEEEESNQSKGIVKGPELGSR